MSRELAIKVLARKTYEFILQAGKGYEKACAVQAYIKCSHLEEALLTESYWRQVAANHIAFQDC